MLNPFPHLLTYGFFAPTLLRVAAAVVLAYIAYRQYRQRETIAALRLPVVGGGAWVASVSAAIALLTAASLFFGYGAQWAALVGAILSLKSLVWGGGYPALFPLSRASSALLFVICLSLLLSGAGAAGFDLPL